MLAILSPAKTLDPAPILPASLQVTSPLFPEDTAQLVRRMVEETPESLAKRMGISPKLADLNALRWAQFPQSTLPAGWTYKGDVYQGLAVETLPEAAVPAFCARVRILSGLYGLLSPSDGIAPHRLEMGTKLDTPRGTDLYGFWGDRLARALNDAAEAAGTEVILNLASQEYSAAVDRAVLKPRWVTVHFKEARGNQLKVLGLFAKRARGRMARWMVETGAGEADLPAYEVDGYGFRADLSSAAEKVFVR